MASDLNDQPPYSEALQRELEAQAEREHDARPENGGVPPVLGMFSVTLPAAPGTPEARLSRLSEPVRVSREFFQNAVNAAWLLSMQDREITPSSVQAVASGVFPESSLGDLQHLLASEKFRLALLNRGIEPGRSRADGLTAEMVACVRALSDPTLGLTLKQRLRGAGVTWAQYQGWLKFSPFREALTSASEGGLRGAVALANTKLVENVDGNDLKSIQYLHELTGYFTPGKQQALDTQQMIRDLMTVVLKRVTDPATLIALAGDFRVLQEQMALGSSGAAGAAGEPGALTPGFGEGPVDMFDLELESGLESETVEPPLVPLSDVDAEFQQDELPGD